MAHGLFCTCRKCNPSFMDALFGTTSKKNNFKKPLKDGTTIYGPKGIDKTPGFKHGHYGPGFHRTPHSSLGSVATGRPHGTRGHKTQRG